jgi:16S rRNA (guanine527-N7)-methyltransferase
VSDALDAALEDVGEPEYRPRLAAFARLLLAANASHNLTAAREPADIAEHIRDALSLLPYVREPLVDIGSGGGFPALPLAIVTGFRAALIESVAKKARFLAATVAELGLPVRVIAERAESAAHDPALRGAFASATARAVGSLPTVLELSLPFLADGGVAVLQRGRVSEEERRSGEDAARMLGASLGREIELDGVRRIILAEKLSASPQRFPRRVGIPQKRPLCSRPLSGITADA